MGSKHVMRMLRMVLRRTSAEKGNTYRTVTKKRGFRDVQLLRSLLSSSSKKKKYNRDKGYQQRKSETIQLQSQLHPRILKQGRR